MRFADFPFLRYMPFILLGVFMGQSSWSPGAHILLLILSIIWVGYLILVLFRSPSNWLFQPSHLAYTALVAFGSLLVQYTKDQLSADLDLARSESYLGEVTRYDLQKLNSFENLLEVKSAFIEGEWMDLGGKILIYHQREEPLKPGEILLVKKKPEKIGGPLNPHEFDYKEYLARKGIYYRQFVGNDFQVISSGTDRGFLYFLIHLRHAIGQMLTAKIPDENSAQIALALLLGQKKELDPTIREAYTQAGVMHILAVSGLHVGIIYALFILMLRPLKLKIGKARMYLFCVVLVIWLYAFLTGLSSSVVRAATMFSLLTFGQMRERRPSIYNILAFSAILMITFNPYVIYEVGFQLSYLAVLGIVTIR